MKRKRKALIVFGVVMLAAALVWAAAEISGQINQMAQDTGYNSADMEILSLETIRKPVSAPCPAAQESELRNKILAGNTKYEALRDKARIELRNSGKVSAATAGALKNEAMAFKNLCDQYAAFWKACNMPFRAKLAEIVGQTRVKSAMVIASGMDQDALTELRTTQGTLQTVRREYVNKAVANKEISPQDQADIKANLIPRIQSLSNTLKSFTNTISQTIFGIQSGFFSGGSSDSSGGGGRDVDPRVERQIRLLRVVQFVARALMINVVQLEHGAVFLAGGPAPPAPYVSFLPFCFVGASFQ